MPTRINQGPNGKRISLLILCSYSVIQYAEVNGLEKKTEQNCRSVHKNEPFERLEWKSHRFCCTSKSHSVPVHIIISRNFCELSVIGYFGCPHLSMKLYFNCCSLQPLSIVKGQGSASSRISPCSGWIRFHMAHRMWWWRLVVVDISSQF